MQVPILYYNIKLSKKIYKNRKSKFLKNREIELSDKIILYDEIKEYLSEQYEIDFSVLDNADNKICPCIKYHFSEDHYKPFKIGCFDNLIQYLHDDRFCEITQTYIDYKTGKYILYIVLDGLECFDFQEPGDLDIIIKLKKFILMKEKLEDSLLIPEVKDIILKYYIEEYKYRALIFFIKLFPNKKLKFRYMDMYF